MRISLWVVDTAGPRDNLFLCGIVLPFGCSLGGVRASPCEERYSSFGRLLGVRSVTLQEPSAHSHQGCCRSLPCVESALEVVSGSGSICLQDLLSASQGATVPLCHCDNEPESGPRHLLGPGWDLFLFATRLTDHALPWLQDFCPGAMWHWLGVQRGDC